MRAENLVGTDHALFAVLAFGIPVAGLIYKRRLNIAHSKAQPRLRLSFHLAGGTLLWTLIGMAVLVWSLESRRWTGLGLVLFCTVQFWSLVFAFAVILALSLRQYARLLRVPEKLVLAGKRLEGPKWLPSSPGEKAAYFYASASAGLCQEVLYRAFLFWYLSHWLPALAAGAVSALVFGASRSYQELRDMAKQMVVGFALFGIYFVGGSIFASAAFHLLFNLQSAQIIFAAIRAEERDPGLLARAEEEARRA